MESKEQSKHFANLGVGISFGLLSAALLSLLFWFTDEMASAYTTTGQNDVAALFLQSTVNQLAFSLVICFALLGLATGLVSAHRLRKAGLLALGMALSSAAGLFFLNDLHWFPRLLSKPGVLYVGVVGLTGLALSWLYLAFHRKSWASGSPRFLRIPMVVGLLFVFLVNGLALYNKKSAQAANTNVIIILIDALRSDHLGSYGYELPTSPALDAFAREGVVFKNSFSQSTHTKPSTASLFTSLYPSQHNVMRGNRHDAAGNFFSDVLDDGFKTMAEYLSDAGYNSAGFLDQGQLHSYMGFAQGFTYYNSYLRKAEQINNDFLRWLPANKHRKFFAYLHYLDVHAPYAPSREYRDMFVDGKSTAVIPEEVADWRKFKKKFDQIKDEFKPEDIEQLVALYDAEIRELDDYLQEIFFRLKVEGVYDQSLIFIVSDHGDSFMEHGDIDHGTTLYDEVLRVPFIVRFPNAAHTGVVETPVQTIDVLPTILEYAGVDTEDNLLMGESVLGFVDGTQPERQNPIFSERMHLLSIRKGDFKLIYNKNLEYGELYDLSSDPGEKINLYAEASGQEHAGRLQQELFDWAESVKDIRPAADGVKLDAKTVEKLKSLGYIR